MDSFELNKIIGAILGTLLFVMGVGFITEAIYEPIEGRGPGYALPEADPAAGHGGEGEEPAAEVPIGMLLASADADQGQSAARKCQGCHNFGQGEANKQGPGLYDVVGRLIGSHEGFNYSEIMQEHRAAGDHWTYDELNAFLIAPQVHMPKTKMNFGGLKNDKERANVIAFLSTLSASPVPFPPAEAAAPEGEPSTAEATTTPTDAAPVTPTDVTPTPTTTQTETQVQGTPTTSGTEAAPPLEERATEVPGGPGAPAESSTEAPATDATPATPAATTTDATPATPATPVTDGAPAPMTPATEGTPATPMAPVTTTTTP